MLDIILSLLPFVLITYLLVFKKVKAFKVMGLVYFLTFLLLLIHFKANPLTLLSATARGILISFEVFMIILSVLFLYYLMKNTKRLDVIKDYLHNFSSDKQIQIILIGFFVVAFFEAIAGFGTPAAIAAPLLVLIGIAPFTAVIITLVADSVPVTFGAFGTPIIVGILSSITDPNLEQITIYSSILSGIIALFLPLILLIIYNLIEFKNLKKIKTYIPISLVAGISFSIPFILTAIFLGPELPSVIGAIVGFTITSLCIKKQVIKTKTHNSKIMSSLLPYFSLIGLFIITRLDLFNIGTFLRNINLNITLTDNISHSLNLFHPWFLIFLTFLIFLIIFKINTKQTKEIIKESFDKSKFVLITLVFTLAFVQLILFSHINNSEFIGIAQTIGSLFSGLGIFYIFFAPFIGAFGSFIAGSATVSNIIFSSLQNSVAIENSISQSLILALQNAGAAAGNMIAIHNIVAVLALVGLANKESNVLRITFIITIIYCFILGIFGLIGYYLFF